MKKRKTFVGMTIFIAILVLGVGYAAVSDVTLNLTGTANVQANAEFRVEYDTSHTVKVSPDADMTWNAGDVRDVVTGSYTDATNATMTVNLDATNRSASAVYEIVNSSAELSADITGTVVSEEFTQENAEYLVATSALYVDEECTTPLTESVLESGDVAYLKVTVSLKKLPVESIVNATFTVTTTAEPVAVELAN